MSRVIRILGLAALLSVASAGSALANDWAGSDPSSNFQARSMPASCDNDPNSASCLNAAVSSLDQARASLGQPAYRVPSNFDSLGPAQQGFVLANLDRQLYGLAPMKGLTAGLNQDAARGVRNDSDPQPSINNYYEWTANWAGGFANMPLAYEAWMYDDGRGSGNIDCTASNSSGCWGHRHDVLWKFDGSQPLAVGSAAGTDSGGEPGYAMLFYEGDDTYRPSYTYTWAQAVSAGAGDGSGASGSGHGNPVSVPARAQVRINKLAITGHHISLTIVAPMGSKLRCALTRHLRHGWARDHFRPCLATTALSVKRAGRYRLRVRDSGSSATRYLRVH